MKLLVRLYRMLNLVRTPKAAEFDRLYRLDPDPYDTRNSLYEQHKQEALVGMIAGRRYGSALDLGCGPGVVTRRIATYCDRVVGVDFAPAAIETARRETNDPRISYAIADIRKMVEVAAYDLIICSEVLYYLNAQELEDVIGRLARALTPRGGLVIVARADDDYLCPALGKQLSRTRSIEEASWDRPFAISFWQARAV